ncbi:MAG: helix-turn-helix domain-containing protein, partial [Arcanobacterium sp.]|nr:helix-turn-helix domain-containing protein [Arcanobacterium sp.]
MTYTDVVSKHVKTALFQRGLTQAELGKLLEMTQVDLSNRLTGRVRWSLRDIDALTAAGIALPAPT